MARAWSPFSRWEKPSQPMAYALFRGSGERVQALVEVGDGGLPVAAHRVDPPPHPGAVALQARVLSLAPDRPRPLDGPERGVELPEAQRLTASQQRAWPSHHHSSVASSAATAARPCSAPSAYRPSQKPSRASTYRALPIVVPSPARPASSMARAA